VLAQEVVDDIETAFDQFSAVVEGVETMVEREPIYGQ
jgi:hypothetical protein